ncbi:MAG: sugar phosphate isomerase/epimerase, partial [Bacteroidota bacterium]
MTPILLTDTVTTDLDRALHYALLWGHEGLAIRTLGRHGERVPYVNEAKLKRRLDEHELPLVAVEPGLFEG